MNKVLKWKTIFVIVLVIISLLYILPTFGKRSMVVTIRENTVQTEIDFLKDKFSKRNLSVVQDKNKFTIEGYGLTDAIMNEYKSFPFVEDAAFKRHWAEKYLLSKKINLGLDLQGGMSLVLAANYDRMEKAASLNMGAPVKFDDARKKEIIGQALEKIEGRINSLGVAETTIRMKGVDAIEIQLPGVRDPQSVKKILGMTGRVEYHIVNDEYSVKAKEYMKTANIVIPDRWENNDELKNILINVAEQIKLPKSMLIYFYFDRHKTTNKIMPLYPEVLEGEIALEGSDIAKSFEGADEYQRPAVHFELTPKGAEKFSKVTSQKNQGKRLAIVIDDQVRSAPTINEQINGGKAVITGSFTNDEVKLLARIINEGALPVDLKIVEERTVGPSLGQDSIDAGIKAMVIAIIGIFIFMMARYKLSGLIANIGLVLNLVLLLALMSMLGVTMTLPGVAGLILSLAISVDANVIIYERMREELRAGKSVRLAISNGFDRAFWTIFDSNATGLLAAFVLSQFGTGPIKGFAVIMIIGTLVSMFVALYVVKLIYQYIAQMSNLKKLSV